MPRGTTAAQRLTTGTRSCCSCKNSATTFPPRSARCRTRRGATACRRIRFRSSSRRSRKQKASPGLATETRPHQRLGLVRGGCDFLFDGSAHQVAPLGPGTVVILHVAEAEQILQHEPGVRAALADAAVGDHFFRAVNSLLAV